MPEYSRFTISGETPARPADVWRRVKRLTLGRWRLELHRRSAR